MICTLAVSNYRSMLSFVTAVGGLTVITGANGSGKSNLYRSLRLLSQSAGGNVVESLAREGGLQNVLWAGPETLSRGMRQGQVPVQGGPRRNTVRLQLGFASDSFGYSIALGMPSEGTLTAFRLDPEIKIEMLFTGAVPRPASALVVRKGPVVKIRDGRSWQIVHQHVPNSESMFSQDFPEALAPEVPQMRQFISDWRFYDHFRTDRDAPARQPQIGSRAPVLANDGHNLAAALQTIIEIGDADALHETIAEAFDGASIQIRISENGLFSVGMNQQGLLRALDCSELSDGTVRYLLLVAALLTPRPPPLLVLNEPETSLHPDLLKPLARLIHRAAETTQLWVVTHANRLMNALDAQGEIHHLPLARALSETGVLGVRELDQAPWQWPK